MYRVLIVDDEPWVLKGIRSTFNWDELGFQVIAETTDSVEALDIILRQEPDVILTDIRMPELSGIDLMKQCRERGIKSEFIIISGASDFHYAQESIRLGCFDYLLKPLQFEEANTLLGRLLRHLDRISHQKDLDFLEALHHADDNAMKQLLNGKGVMSNQYQVIYCSAAAKEHLALVSEWIKKDEHIIIQADPNKMIVITGCSESKCKYPFLAASFAASSPAVKERLHIGVSEISGIREEIPRLIEQAHFAMHSFFVYLTGGVFMQSREIHPAVKRTVQAVCAAAHHHSPDRLNSLLDEIPGIFRKAGAGMKEVVYLWNQVISTINNKLNDGAAHEELSFMDYGGLVSKFADLEELLSCLKDYMLPAEAAESAITEPDQMVNENFKELLEFVNNHFEEELHLRELSGKFYINYTYCCDLFQKTAKVTFTDYVTRLRMKKAGQLLRETDLTITEICREVGYKDYHYFNKVFKKSYGITPSNYRKIQTAPNY